MGLFRRVRGVKPFPVPGLRKDAATPMGTIWSVVAAEDDGEAPHGDLLDSERVLGVGDIINVRNGPGGTKLFALRVVGREDDIVHTEYVRH